MSCSHHFMLVLYSFIGKQVLFPYYTYKLLQLLNYYSFFTQNGVTALDVAKTFSHDSVCQELQSHMSRQHEQQKTTTVSGNNQLSYFSKNYFGIQEYSINFVVLLNLVGQLNVTYKLHSFTDHNFHYRPLLTKLNHVFKSSKIDEMELVIVNVLLQLMIMHTLMGLLLCREPLN